MSQISQVPHENRKRIREENDSTSAGQGAACLAGQAPKFSRHKEESSDVKFGSGVETNEHRIETRIKQIQFGKNTIGYDNYVAAVPKKMRVKQSAIHPRTPDPYEESSKRQFDGRVKAWRRDLHKWDDMDNIQKVAVPPSRTTNKGNNEVESGEVAEAGSTSTFGSWAKKVESVPTMVLAPVQTLSSNVNRANKKDNTTRGETNSSNESGGSYDASRLNTEMDSPMKAAAAVSYLIGEDIGGLDGVDYDCEAPDDGDEDVL